MFGRASLFRTASSQARDVDAPTPRGQGALSRSVAAIHGATYLEKPLVGTSLWLGVALR